MLYNFLALQNNILPTKPYYQVTSRNMLQQSIVTAMQLILQTHNTSVQT
jgi:hypothetical protein